MAAIVSQLYDNTGQLTQLDRERIIQSILAAAETTDDEITSELVTAITDEVIGQLTDISYPSPLPNDGLPNFSDVQTIVERLLINKGYVQVAQAYVAQRNPLSQTHVEDVRPQLTQNALTILERRYLRKDANGKPIETPAEMFRRVAHNIALADKLYGATDEEVARTEGIFYKMMANLEFLPNSPTLRGAGRRMQQLSGCFVVPIGDSLEEIFDALKAAALIHQTGGGVGYSFSNLRPRGDVVGSTGNVAGGPISFMNVFNAAAQEITQGGVRMGANIAILRVDHPDILEFIASKNDGKSLQNFNISVAITDAFMQAVRDDLEYDLINPRTRQAIRKVRARDVSDRIVENAWKNGDPGVIFIDRIDKDNPTPLVGQIESTNPCGEQPLLSYESCNLGSVNLSKMVHDGTVDWEKLEETAKNAVHFLDNVIDMNRYALPQIERLTKANRKIGLGVMGFADMLIQLGIPYNSEEALDMAGQVMNFISKVATQKSQDLALQRGEFPNFKGSIYDVPGAPKLRNATRTTIAPNGTTGVIASCNGGIEPLFALVYKRKTLFNKDGATETLLIINRSFERVAKERGFYSPDLMERIAETGSLKDIEGIPEDIKRVFVTAHDVSPEWHVRMQATFQKHVDNAVSKTINFPYHATVEDVRKAYLLAYELGCKGITTYRDGSRAVQVLSKGVSDGERKRGSRTPRPRPAVTRGSTEKIMLGCNRTMYVTINEDQKGLCEVFLQMGKSGGCTASQSEAIGRLISLALRSGIETRAIIRQLKGIRCPSPSWHNGGSTLSCSDAVAKALERYLNGSNPGQQVVVKGLVDICPECPECGGMVELVEGCAVCRACGYSQCG